jgi:cellobiose transport system permease protein
MTERSIRRNRLDQAITPYAFITPYFLLFALIGAFPLLFTLWVSLRDWDLIGGDGGFVGLQNFVDVLGEPTFWVALRNTASIFLLSVIPQLILATAIAYALSTNLRAKTFWRMGVLLPYVLAPVAVTLVFNDLFGDSFGLINQGLQAIGLPSVAWHENTIASHLAIATMVNFRWTGYNALILLAAMQAVPHDYVEAARLDGAGPLRTFFSITLPQIRPTMIFVVVTATIGGLQIFDEPQLFSIHDRGGPDNQWVTLTMYLYNIGWTQLNLGRASAIAWLLFVVIVGVGLLNFSLTRMLRRDTPTSRGAVR